MRVTEITGTLKRALKGSWRNFAMTVWL